MLLVKRITEDLKYYHSIDAEAELTQILKLELRLERPKNRKKSIRNIFKF